MLDLVHVQSVIGHVFRIAARIPGPRIPEAMILLFLSYCIKIQHLWQGINLAIQFAWTRQIDQRLSIEARETT